MSKINLSLAGLGFRLFSRDDSVPLDLHPNYLPFVVPSASPDGGAYEVVADEADLNLGSSADPASGSAWESFIWKLAACAGDEHLLEVRDLPTGNYIKVAMLSADFGSGRILARQRLPQPVYAINYPEEQLILLNRLSHFDAGLIHSSGVVVEGKAFLFCGRSGAGKTTIERLWKAAGFRLLNDDRMVVRMIDGVPHACSTPWHGEDPEVNAEMHPLGAVFHLNKADANRLVPIEGAAAVARLYATTLAPFYSREGTLRVLDAYNRALENVPSFDLYFTRDRRTVELCLAEVT